MKKPITICFGQILCKPKKTQKKQWAKCIKSFTTLLLPFTYVSFQVPFVAVVAAAG